MILLNKMITAICNIYIGTEQKFEIFKESFPEVFDISDNWLIYIRGKYKQEIINFIKETYKEKLKNTTFFENLYENNWTKSTIKMLEKSKYSYIYLYREDHFLVNNLDYFKEVIKDINSTNIDYLQYSMFKIGPSSETIDILHPDEFNNLKIIELNDKSYLFIKHEFAKTFYPFSLVSISKKSFFMSILNGEDIKSLTINKYLQYLLHFFVRFPLNKIFIKKVNSILLKTGIKLNFFPKNTPFNLEKSFYDFNFNLMPVKIGVPKKEIFANWDDDNGYSGSSLIKRGLYPKKLIGNSFNIGKYTKLKEYTINIGDNKDFVYHSEHSRTPIPLKYIKVLSGTIKITGLNEEYILNKNEEIFIHANIPHKIIGIENAKYGYIIENYIKNISYFNMN